MKKNSTGFGEASGIEDLANLYLNALRSMIDALPGQEKTADVPQLGSEQEILMLLAKAQAAWLTSGMRYWKQMADIMSRNGLGITELAVGASTAGDPSERVMQRLILIDKARACLREVSDASVSEAEELRRQLTDIEFRLRATMDPGAKNDPNRYHKHKP